MCFSVKEDQHAEEFVANAVQQWIAAAGTKTAYIEPGR
jgi:hypothetical protein